MSAHLQEPEEDQEQETKGTNMTSETVKTTLAELHVHGILAGLAALCRHAFSEEAIAITITCGGLMFLARGWFRKQHKRLKTKRPPMPRKWEHHNF